jgi:hypothetical protein
VQVVHARAATRREPDHHARGQRAKRQIEPEVLGEHGEPDDQYQRDADWRLS